MGSKCSKFLFRPDSSPPFFRYSPLGSNSSKLSKCIVGHFPMLIARYSSLQFFAFFVGGIQDTFHKTWLTRHREEVGLIFSLWGHKWQKVTHVLDFKVQGMKEAQLVLVGAIILEAVVLVEDGEILKELLVFSLDNKLISLYTCPLCQIWVEFSLFLDAWRDNKILPHAYQA